MLKTGTVSMFPVYMCLKKTEPAYTRRDCNKFMVLVPGKASS
jgi:hypothetical protein